MASAAAIDERGRIVGQGNLGAGAHAVLFEDGVITDLGTANGLPSSRATGLNDRGEIVGFGYVTGLGDAHALQWNHRGVRDLHPPDAVRSWAAGINSSGVAVGTFLLPNAGQYSLAVWERGKLSAVDPGYGNAINRRGIVAGAVYGRDAALWERGERTDLGWGWESMVTAITDDGDLAGHRGLGAVNAEAYFVKGTVPSVLPPLPGDPAALAYGVNRRGQVVGVSIWCEFECRFYRMRPVLWQDGQVIELPRLGEGEGIAAGINDDGDIVGTVGTSCSYLETCEGSSRAVLWRVE
jgi:uncharacterized membrane protein